MESKYPIYIVSKGRWESRLTSKALEKLKMPYYIVVEKQQYKDYDSVIDSSKILVLPKKYQEEYDTCDDLGSTKSKGPGAARNFCWDHSIQNNFKRHWVMDDNIRGFQILNHNKKTDAETGRIFRIAEDFIDRYTNIALSGFHYDYFMTARDKHPPYILNTRIYSILLIQNDIPYRWRGRYNEDTDLSLRALKDGWCTLLFNYFLAMKVTTQVMKGGCSDEFYFKEGTLNKSKMQVNLHPDVSTLVFKYKRWHHYVNYKPFQFNKLIKRKGLIVPKRFNNHGLVLVDKKDEGDDNGRE